MPRTRDTRFAHPQEDTISGFYGADVAQLRDLASRLDHASNALDHNRSFLDNAVRNTSWTGPDAQRFSRDWSSDLSRLIREAVNMLREAAKSARKNADDQDQASNASEGPSFSLPRFDFPPAHTLPQPIDGFPDPIQILPVDLLDPAPIHLDPIDLFPTDPAPIDLFPTDPAPIDLTPIHVEQIRPLHPDNLLSEVAQNFDESAAQ